MRAQRIGVVGAGVMGSEIAQVAAAAGLEVVLRDVDAAAIRRGPDHVRDIGDRRVARGRLSAGDAAAILPGAVDEASRCVAEGVAAPDDTDIAVTLGGGWETAPLTRDQGRAR